MSDDAPLIGSLSATLDAVDRALERLRDGSYRTCETCGAPIEEAQLAADPLRTRCRAHLEIA